MKYWKRIFAFAAASGTIALEAGENMLFNSGFELGMSGYSGERHITYEPGKPINYPGPTPVVSLDAFAGNRCILINGVEKDAGWNFVTHEFNLKPGRKYTFSAWIRGEDAGSCSFQVFSSANYKWYNAGSGNLKATPEWTRRSFSFTYEPGKRGSEPAVLNTFFIFAKAPDKKCKIWLDNIKLEEGDLTGYTPMHTVETAVEAPAFLIEKNMLEAEAGAVSATDGNKDVEVELLDKFTGKVIAHKKIAFRLTAGKGASAKVVFDKVPYGGFTVRTKDPAPNGAAEAWTVRIHKNDRKYDDGYQVGIHGAAGESVTWAKWHDGDSLEMVFRDTFGNAPGDFGRILRMTGSTLLYPWFPAFFSFAIQNHAGRGNFDWRVSDFVMENARKNNLKLIFFLPAQSLMGHDAGKNTGKKVVPDWLRKLDRYGKPLGAPYGDWKGSWIVRPPGDVVGEYAGKIAERYGSDIAMYQLFGEANGYMTPAILMEYAKPFYESIKKYARDTPVVTLTPTQDQGSKTGWFFEEALKIGMGKYTDGYGFHPYGSATDDAAISAMSEIRTIHEVTGGAGAKKTLWNTEVYYLRPLQEGTIITRNQYPADAVTRRFCIDAGEGVRASLPLFIEQLFHPPHMLVSAVGIYSGGWKPTDRFAAYNAAAYFLCGATDCKPVFMAGNVLCYVFRNMGKYFSVIWSIDGKAEMDMTLPNGVKVTAYDMFGNKNGEYSGKLKMKLLRPPVFLEWMGAKADPGTIHRAANYSNYEEISVHGMKMLHGYVRVYLVNKTSSKIAGFAKISSDYLRTKGRTFGNIPPFGAFYLDIPAEYTGKVLMGDIEGTVCLTGSKEVYKYPFRIPRANIHAIPFSVNLSPDGTMSVRREEDRLLFVFDMKKASFTAPSNPEQPWTGSSVELFFDLAPEEALNGMQLNRYTPNCFQVAFRTDTDGRVQLVAPTAGPPAIFKKMTAEVKKSGGGYVATLSMPTPEKDFAFTTQFTENGRLTVWSGTQNFRDRSGFQLVKIKGASK
ncbi:MAG: Carbohydrate binding domain protein [Lentisphaerae bacterium ADurb.Bin242]|nr:MAG: Carbohydrate binding domain protein [Lentisphaerae bacterium ADurb.Bin242]